MGSGRRCRRFAIVAVVAMVLSGCVRGDLEFLASDATGGRDNDTPGSVLAQEYLLAYLEAWTEGPSHTGTGVDAYKQQFTLGTNLIGVMPGTDLADEYVLVGAHYDHVAACADKRAGDDICNGATDNAAGVVAALAVARAIHFSAEPPRRSIIFAFWDREEDGLLGARHYVQNPLIPLADTVAYVNLDIQGSNLRPSLRNVSFAVGAETGGARLRQLVDEAVAPSSLDTRQLSVVFGQGRSDHVPFIGAGVPSVFLTDATGPCYHTDSDDLAVVDFDKLTQQIRILHRLTRSLSSTDALPTFTGNTPLATYDDAVVLLGAVELLLADLATFTTEQATQLVESHAELQTMVDAGPAAFDGTDITRVLTMAAMAVTAFTTGPCDGFLAAP